MHLIGIKENIADLLESIDIKINGERPWDIQIYNEGLFQRVLREGSLDLGEAYMDGWWDCKDHYTDRFFEWGNIIYSVQLEVFGLEKTSSGKLS